MKRKLTTIFCADVHNYSKMMARDEAATLQKLRRYRKIMSDLFESHDGRQVNTWGDAVIGEFSSVVEAVRCAVEIQDAVEAENRDLPSTSRMRFRIGINMGDVMDDEGDLYGDGVNIAARLETLCEPGGIMVSENVYEFTHKQLAFGYDFAGKHQVKDGEEPVIGYRVRVGGSNAEPEAEPVEPVKLSSAGKEKKVHNRVIGWHNRLGNMLDRFLHWYPEQSAGVKGAVLVIGFLAMINILFTGIATPWFIFPSAPLAFFILMRQRKKNKKRGR